jgi:tRNA threonylcarbamoyladenosine biosynthesis protein TsaE
LTTFAPRNDDLIMRVARIADGLMIDVESENETERLGRAIADSLTPGTVVGMVGPLGAGKTFLVRAIAEALGVDAGAIASPTFVLIHEYEGRLPIYHFDAYRLETPQAFEDLGVVDYWGGDGACLVEWADRVRGLLPDDCWLITLKPTGPTSRSVWIELPAAAARVADRLEKRLA